jgi:hypothetical protein
MQMESGNQFGDQSPSDGGVRNRTGLIPLWRSIVHNVSEKS